MEHEEVSSKAKNYFPQLTALKRDFSSESRSPVDFPREINSKGYENTFS